MREIRTSGSEGGGAELNRSSLPLSRPDVSPDGNGARGGRSVRHLRAARQSGALAPHSRRGHVCPTAPSQLRSSACAGAATEVLQVLAQLWLETVTVARGMWRRYPGSRSRPVTPCQESTDA